MAKIIKSAPEYVVSIKKCKRCHQEKEESEFGKDKNTKSGLRIYCKDCNRELDRKNYKRNKQKILDRGKEYRKNNPELVKANWKKWSAKNKDKRKEYMKNYRSSEEYRLMKQKHDNKYNSTHKIKSKVRTKELIFKAACRAYADKHIKKIKCSYCGSTKNLETHHSEGYKLKSLAGVIVVCRECHRQVIHGRGSRING